MIDLNNPDDLKKLDPKDVLGSTGNLSFQCEQIWAQVLELELSAELKNCKNIVLCGMGGSAYGGYVAGTLFKDSLKVPLISNNDYHLPGFTDSNTLVLLSSYSGSTEEVISCAEEAQAKKSGITGITGGGKLEEFFRTNNLPALIFDPKFNPSGQPRLGTGYMVLGIIAVLNKLGFIQVSEDEVRQAISELKVGEENIKSLAKTLARKLYGSIPVIFAAEFLSGNAHILRNQFNETAKSFSVFSLLSELNHHLMEGLKNPTDKKLFILFANSEFYSDKLKKRIELTKDVILKNNIPFDEIKAKGSSKLSQMLYILSFGGYLSLYLAFLYGQDPSVIPWVDYFKEQLEK